MRILSSLVTVFATVSAASLEIVKSSEPDACNYKSVKGDTISVHYTGRLTNSEGEIFDSSLTRKTPFTFKLGSNMVIKGWDEGLVDMCVGEKRLLTIPPEMGYGSRTVGPIPANSILFFETELTKIQRKDEL